MAEPLGDADLQCPDLWKESFKLQMTDAESMLEGQGFAGSRIVKGTFFPHAALGHNANAAKLAVALSKAKAL